jgi:dTMP kinase
VSGAFDPKGVFITFEGIEGVGKSTHLKFAQSIAEKAGRRSTLTREPGGTGLGEAIRAVLLDRAHTGMCGDAELLLLFAARAEHIDKVIRPALARSEVVLCDRFTDATYAYQGGGRGIDAARIAALERFVQGGLEPDHTVLLDAPVEVALERARGRGAADRFEAEAQAFFERVRASYLARAGRSARYHVIDASRSLQDVQDELRAVLREWFER